MYSFANSKTSFGRDWASIMYVHRVLLCLTLLTVTAANGIKNHPSAQPSLNYNLYPPPLGYVSPFLSQSVVSLSVGLFESIFYSPQKRVYRAFVSRDFHSTTTSTSPTFAAGTLFRSPCVVNLSCVLTSPQPSKWVDRIE